MVGVDAEGRRFAASGSGVVEKADVTFSAGKSCGRRMTELVACSESAIESATESTSSMESPSGGSAVGMVAGPLNGLKMRFAQTKRFLLGWSNSCW